MESREAILLELAEQIEKFRLCGPSDDPDEQTAVIYGFKSLAKRFIGYAEKIKNPMIQKGINKLDLEIDTIYGVYDLHSDLLVIIDDLRELLSQPVEWSSSETEIIDSSIINGLSQTKNANFDLTKVIEFCREINSTFSSGYYLATSLLIRALINHIPPIFGQKTFAEVVAQSTSSRQKLFRPLEDIARLVADLHTHDTIRSKENLPTSRQIEIFKPNIEFLLQEILVELQK